MKNILCVSLFFPYPGAAHGGPADLFRYIEGLVNRGHQVSLVSFLSQDEAPYLARMRPYCQEIVTIPAISTWGQRIAKAPLLLRYPRQWVEAYSITMRAAIAEILSRCQFDFVHFNYFWMSQYLDLVENCPAGLDEADVDSLVLLRRSRQARSWLERQYLSWCWGRTVELEIEACEQADVIFTRSPKDRYYLECLAPGRLYRLLPPFIECLEQPAQEQQKIEKNSLLFAGNMGRDLNIQAVRYFCEQVFPFVLAQVPEARLYVVGAGVDGRLEDLRSERVLFTGYVEDLPSYYALGQVFIAPMLVGGGIIVKVLNAMAAGRPVVTTSIGNEGIGARPGRDLLVEDDPKAFAAAVISLLQGHERWQRLAENGRQFVEQNFSWQATLDGLERGYMEAGVRPALDKQVGASSES